MPAPYVLQVYSQPTKVSEDIWTQWYTEEHIRDMVHFKAAKTGASYCAISHTLASGDNIPRDGNDEKTFFALYQTDRKHCLDHPEYRDKVRLQSQLWDENLSCHDVGVFTPVDLELVEVLGSYEYNETMAPYLIHIQITGPDVETKMQHEHINAASSLNGYRRTLLYRPLEPTRYGAEDVGPYLVMIHEFDAEPGHLESVRKEMSEIGSSVDLALQIRAFKMLSQEGFGGECRVPERLWR